MSREIKFRAWDKKLKKLSKIGHFDFENGYCADTTGKGTMGQSHKLDKNTILMQYTGLKDRHGKEIYEGDILDDGGIIEFRDDLNWDSGGSVHSGFFSTKGYEYKESGCLSYHYQISEHEVIGNIYENPELLK